jgi:endonuclease III related protein
LCASQLRPEWRYLQPDDHIRSYFNTLYQAWGPQHWWPGQSPFEVIVGVYLTQNTSWTNVERALVKLRKARLLTVSGIRRTPLRKLEKLIRSAGYFRQKARRMKTFVTFLDQRYAGSLSRMFFQPTAKLRKELLSLNGIGPETADSILLYAGNHPVFVVDAYTLRIIERHQLVPASATYEDIRELFERALLRLEASFLVQCSELGWPRFASRFSQANGTETLANSCHLASKMSTAERTPAAQVFNEMHGLIVAVGKNFCKKSQPDCERCPLKKFLPGAD